MADEERKKAPQDPLIPEALKRISERLNQHMVGRPRMPNPAQEILNRFAPIREAAAKFVNALTPVVQQIGLSVRGYQALERIGWLPHATTPLHLLSDPLDDVDDAQLSSAIESYYRENWAEVRERLLADVESLDVNAESKLVFREGIEAHSHQLYRASCRLLLVECERVVRQDLFDGTPGENVRWEGKRSTPTRVLRTLADEQPLPDGYLSLLLYVKLTEHLYERISSADIMQQFAMDPVPNRNAALHGIISYNTFQNSLNAMFLTDYVFHIVADAKISHEDGEAD
ncbi:hypothetical protein [Azorhizobium caulinodans]|uniref:hypothetical protein n=1 Tax=Azorhizobium caulinodans TaxID=7 RepID=UPI002FBDE795